jgi:16S rRNA processing protein RimM
MNPMASASQWIVLARILRPQGRRGEVLADLFTDFPQRFAQQPRVWLAPQGFADSPAAGQLAGDITPTDPASAEKSADGPPPSGNLSASPAQLAEVASHWLPVGRNAGRIVLRFAGIDTIEQAALLAGFEVLVPLAERTPIDSGAAYISDLIGCTVFDHGQPLGTVASVDFPTTPDGARRLDAAAPLLVLATPSGDEVLVPFARAFLVELDPAAKSIRMALPEGLAEINLQPNRGPNLKPNRAAPEK